MKLTDLLIAPGAPPMPPAWKQNAVLDHLKRQRLLGVVARFDRVKEFPHPWDISVRRFEAPEGAVSTLDPKKTWVVSVAAGVVNDDLASILYLRSEDPRGWVPPENYAGAQPGDRDYDPRWIERDLLDDPNDPPVLVLLDPPVGNVLPAGLSDFTRITDEQRPGIEGGAFCAADTWELELWRAHVLLTAAPFRASAFAAELPPPRLVKYRLATSPRLPAATYGASAGGWVELGTLYLLRDPEFPEDAEVFVRQREWWPLRAVIAQPGGELVNIFDALAEDSDAFLPPGFTDLLRDQLEDTLQGAAQAYFWSV